jgi:hypothetical protein
MIPGPWQIGQQRRIVGGLTACFPADYCLQLQARRRALSIQGVPDAEGGPDGRVRGHDRRAEW